MLASAQYTTTLEIDDDVLTCILLYQTTDELVHDHRLMKHRRDQRDSREEYITYNGCDHSLRHQPLACEDLI